MDRAQHLAYNHRWLFLNLKYQTYHHGGRQAAIFPHLCKRFLFRNICEQWPLDVIQVEIFEAVQIVQVIQIQSIDVFGILRALFEFIAPQVILVNHCKGV